MPVKTTIDDRGVVQEQGDGTLVVGIPSTFSSLQGSLNTVSTIANLSSVGNVSDGTIFGVSSVRDAFMFASGSTLTADGITILTASGGRWLRKNLGDSAWQRQTAWHIHSGTGNDENVGNSPDTPLKTYAELYRRIGGKFYLTGAVTVNILTDLPASDPVVANVIVAMSGGILFLSGSSSLIRTGTISNYLPKTASVAFCDHIQDNNGSFSAADRDKFFYLPSSDAWFLVGGAPSTTTAFITQPLISTEGNVQFGQNGTVTTPGNINYQVYNNPKIDLVLDVVANYGQASTSYYPVVMRDLNINNRGNAGSIKGTAVFYRCAIYPSLTPSNLVNLGIYYRLCSFVGNTLTCDQGAIITANSCVANAVTVQRYGVLSTTGGSLISLGAFNISGPSNAQIFTPIFVSGTSGMTVQRGGVLQFSTGPIYGRTTNATGLTLKTGGIITYTSASVANTLFFISGTTNQILIDGFPNLIAPNTGSAHNQIASITTFDQLSTAPFNNVAFSPYTGATISNL